MSKSGKIQELLELRLPSRKINPVWQRRSCPFKEERAEGGREGFWTSKQCLNGLRCGFLLKQTGNWESYAQPSLGLEIPRMFCILPSCFLCSLGASSAPQNPSPPKKKPRTQALSRSQPVSPPQHPPECAGDRIVGSGVGSHQAWQNGNLL